jgi:two-component sensor histidine kinase
VKRARSISCATLVPSFVTSIQCRHTELPALRAGLAQWLETERVAPQAAFDVMLATHEAAKNAIAHAAPSDFIKVRAALEDDDVVIEVTDTNAEPWELDSGNGAELRGLTLIHTLARHVETVQQPEGTALVMLIERR